MKEILQICQFQEDHRADQDGKRRLLGLGDDNVVYIWNWFKGGWQPYMDHNKLIDGAAEPTLGDPS